RFIFFFFVQAEDGIRDFHVTGVQTCALPISDPIVHHVTGAGANIHEIQMYDRDTERLFAMLVRMEWPGDNRPLSDLRERMNEIRSEERRVGKEWRYRRSAWQ